MRFEKADPKTVFGNRGYKVTKMQAVIEEFIATGIPMAKIILGDKEYKNLSSAQASLLVAAKKYSKGTVIAKTVNNELYLINTVLIDKEFIVG